MESRKISKLLTILTLSLILILSTVTIIPTSKSQVTRVYESTDVPRNIYDLETIESIIYVQDKGTIEDINVKIWIYHSFDRNLDVYLISPSGTEITLFTDVGGNENNFVNTTLDDEASISITSGFAPFNGAYRPEENLSKLDGEEMQGTWILRIYDDTTTNEGYLSAWSIEITYPSPPIWAQWWFWALVLGVIAVVAIVIIIVVKRRKPVSPAIPIPPPPPPPS
ncbi:MAG: proprotein convertase P-domain-containing protein [archaeon]|nr:proprotein convertase P-domain-containing protein [archaeon]